MDQSLIQVSIELSSLLTYKWSGRLSARGMIEHVSQWDERAYSMQPPQVSQATAQAGHTELGPGA